MRHKYIYILPWHAQKRTMDFFDFYFFLFHLFFFGEMVNAIESMPRLHLPISFFFSFFPFFSIVYSICSWSSSRSILGFTGWVLLIRTITRNECNSSVLFVWLFWSSEKSVCKKNKSPAIAIHMVRCTIFFSSVVQPQVQIRRKKIVPKWASDCVYISVKQWGR